MTEELDALQDRALLQAEIAAASDVPAAPSLGSSTATGFLWLLVQSLSGRLASFVSQLVLAKLLMPQAFGEIGLAYTVTSLVTAMISFGIDDVLLQRLRAIRFWVMPAFWSSLVLALCGMVAMLVAAPFAAHIYGSPGLFGLIAVLATNLPIGALATVPQVKLRAAMDFRYLATYASFELVAIQLATVVLAALGYGAYSFVLPLPFAAAIKAVVFWRKAPSRIGWRYRRVQVRHLIGSGAVVLGTRVVVEIVNQGDYIVLGLLASDAVVGLYFFAFKLAAQPVRMLAGNFGAVLFPALAQLRLDPARQETAALDASRLLAFIVTPLCFLQAAVAGPVLHVMFGARWAGSVLLVQILSLGLPGDAVAWIAGALLVARREFARDLRYLCWFALPFFALVFVGAELGSSLGVAIGVSVYYAVFKPLNSWLVLRRRMRLADFVQIFIAPYVLSGLSIGAAVVLSQLVAPPQGLIRQAAIILLCGPLFYVVGLRLTVPSVLVEIGTRFPLSAKLRRLSGKFGRKIA